MSVLDVLARPRTGSANGRSAGADLRLVPRTRTRPARVPFVLLVLVLLGVGLVGLLVVNTQLQQGSFVLHELERNLADVRDREAALEREVADLEAPQTLATRASALGMVPNPNPGYLVVSEGRDAGVSGDPEPAPTPPPPPQPAASTAATAPPASESSGDDTGDRQPNETPNQETQNQETQPAGGTAAEQAANARNQPTDDTAGEGESGNRAEGTATGGAR